MLVITLTELDIHHYSPVWGHFYHPKKIPLAICSQLPFPAPSQSLICLLVSIEVAFLDISYKENHTPDFVFGFSHSTCCFQGSTTRISNSLTYIAEKHSTVWTYHFAFPFTSREITVLFPILGYYEHTAENINMQVPM